jgi:L-2-hydroxycarboxylate dehydrogenase (NAD+)
MNLLTGVIMPERIHHIPVEELKSFIKDVYIKAGVPSEDAKICSEVLIASDIKGIESHGIGRLKYFYDRIKNGQHQPITNFEIIRESPTTAVVDGHHGMGMVIAKRAMQMAIDKARQYGMGSIAVRNSTHFGIAGYYSQMATDQDMIGLTVTNARPSTSPTFGVQPLLGTNPIAFGAPTNDEFPFLYDGATPITQRGRIEVLARAGKPFPEGWVIDSQNQPMTDAKEVINQLVKGKAAFLPIGGVGELMGGHKGYGLSTMVEILSASLQTGSFLMGLTGIGKDGEPVPFRLGHFFMAISIEAFCSLEDFKSTTTQILHDLRKSNKAPGQKRIYTAGEKEFEKEKIILAQGVPVIPNLQKELLFLKNELNLIEYDFPF